MLAHAARPASSARATPGTLRVIDAAESAFTESEAESLFALAGRAGEGAAAWQATGGWAVGVAAATEMPTPADIEVYALRRLADATRSREP